ncbi:permease [Candidatus Calescamantes bacterium]|nr:permease [Candidatus Calescamantes bacterium]
MKEMKRLLLFISVFLAAYFFRPDLSMIQNAVLESLALLHEYAREHVLLCLMPAFFIAGGIASFISQNAVIKYFGAKSNKFLAYTVASVSGAILAVCSCTVLPLFTGIYKRGAGIGPATAFLYSGPAINVMAIILTARVLGVELGIARAVGAVVFAVIIGLLMHFIFINDEQKRSDAADSFAGSQADDIRPLWQELVFFGGMLIFLIFANWPNSGIKGIISTIHSVKWGIAGVGLILTVVSLFSWFSKDDRKFWLSSTWDFSKQILPLLFAGVLIAGFLLGRPGHKALIPEEWIAGLVGGNSLLSNLIASIAGAFMYFATLTEVPILQGLLGAGMGKGPALALLLAGPALSLPNMLVIKSVLGTKKTLVYITLVVIMATISGILFGNIFK